MCCNQNQKFKPTLFFRFNFFLSPCQPFQFKSYDKFKKSFFFNLKFKKSSFLLKATVSIHSPIGSLKFLKKEEKPKTLNKLQYSLETFHRSNQDTLIVHKPAISEGDWVQSGDLLADCSASIGGELSLGHNILVAYMPWEGYNYEDAILISERLVYDDVYTSIHIEKYELEMQSTKTGAEQITREIPNIKSYELHHLDDDGIAKIGSWIEEGDILVGKITPIQEKTQSAYQKLLYTLLQKKPLSIRDSSLRAPKGIKSKVIKVIKFFEPSENTSKDLLPSCPPIIKYFVETQKEKKNLESQNKANSSIAPFASFRLTMEDVAIFPEGTFLKRKMEINEKKNVEKDARRSFHFNKVKAPSGQTKSADRLREAFVPHPSRCGIKVGQLKVEKVKDATRVNQVKTKIFKNKPILILHHTLPHKTNGGKVECIVPTFVRERNVLTLVNKIKKTNSNLELIKELCLPHNINSLDNCNLTFPTFHCPTFLTMWGSSSLKQSTKAQNFIKKGKLFRFVSQKPNGGLFLKLVSAGFYRDIDVKFKPVKNKLQNLKKVHLYLADKRKIQIGDKMAGRHGNKGIVSQILPKQDMPYLPDGTPIDIVLNPLGVPSRMNVGQIYECLLALAGKYLGENFRIAPFDEIYGPDASRSFVYSKLNEAREKTSLDWLFDPNAPGKMRLFDGRTGDCFDQSITVGRAYILKLVHMVDDKIHARSTGPYSLITQQPLRGRSKQGGQRVGEMEVWSIEGYGAAFVLLELLTIKSDDLIGRMTLWQNLIFHKKILIGTPEAFKVLICELQALCLDIGLFQQNRKQNKQHFERLNMKETKY